ncbi:phosphotransferase family protein [Loigolactobacillus coryniformis]|jgi:thiamine kinase-like enzyme|uniref:Phosphotransferase enzyme family protein n=2 Tax=Loigolactobacillus coryniformis TaxID=1610 RepID=J3EQA3_9LACO|nr:phosphotransferase family protein [Loigolactobacillus coryniformis]MDT3391638.1 phosphotransferase family protein [Bacillota bacterium]ATO44069.1 phosphotransferase [Loigolactobacillus coryniformis subsp. torquens DSM 20004 = KCTC 3535]EJN55515.1 Phosphotransferase enzyme family protein [Loigolactobacillus coryniformis subsp. coryniformis CECT 5711]KRK85244.1 aminoglycoside phosphotransferase [Loigolactobacillus coryniformis subsp. torquens DSM 20004 = KCTC 3535]MBW4802757.1 phosphotransfer
MDFDLDAGWQIQPAGGSTGAAFVGTRAQEKVFLKRNTSPFLAALSMEGISPRLIWTKRISSGDVLTAQEWLNGRTLSRKEMADTAVAKLLARVHHSKLLKKMLQRVGGMTVTSDHFLQQYYLNLSSDLRSHPLLKQVLTYLIQNKPVFDPEQLEVCHGDLNHKNWLLSEQQRLYIVDWDDAMFADAAFDLSTVLCQYVPRDQWNRWLCDYGISSDNGIIQRIEWYGFLNLLLIVKRFYSEQRYHEMNQALLQLRELFTSRSGQ